MQEETIMIVDDNKNILDEMREILSLSGYRVVGVADSQKAAGIAQRIKPDLILLDLRMAGKNGFEVAKELKGAFSTAGIPIVAMSGYFPVDDSGMLFEKSFMKAFLKKPFAISDLITQIEVILGERDSEKLYS